MSARSGAIGCSSERVVVTTTRSGGPSRASSGWASRRSTIIRAPTVSTPGDSRSCGRVSHDGNIATASPRTARSSAVRSSASRPVAVTTSSGPAWASAAATNSRALAGPDQRPLGGAVRRRCSTRSAKVGARQGQFDEPRHRGLDMRVPRCGHDVLPIVGGPIFVKIAPPAVKASVKIVPQRVDREHRGVDDTSRSCCPHCTGPPRCASTPRSGR